MEEALNLSSDTLVDDDDDDDDDVSTKLLRITSQKINLCIYYHETLKSCLMYQGCMYSS